MQAPYHWHRHYADYEVCDQVEDGCEEDGKVLIPALARQGFIPLPRERAADSQALDQGCNPQGENNHSHDVRGLTEAVDIEDGGVEVEER